MLAVLGRTVAQAAAALPLLAQQARHISTTQPTADLRDFKDSIDTNYATFGRSWLAKELRRKSWDDLHKLWYVCLKERNMLLTQIGWEQHQERESLRMSSMKSKYLQRYKSVKLTMNRIKQVLSERASHEADSVKAADMKRVIHYM